MSKRSYIFSTLASDQCYTEWADSPNGTAVEGRSIVIKGGTGVANDRFITPLGVMTEIDASELEWLEKLHAWKAHKDAGHIVVQDKRDDPEKVASGMNTNDQSSPDNPSKAVARRANVDSVGKA
jgi:hypothetical protein